MSQDFSAETEYLDQIQRLPWYGQMTQSFIEFIDPARGETALCMQCGPGVLAIALARNGLLLSLVDSSSEMIKMARKRARNRRKTMVFETGEVGAIPFPDNTFDLSVAVTLIHNIDDPVLGLTELARVTRVGGLVATLDPSPEMRTERRLSYVAKNSLTGFEFKAFQAWSGEAQEHRALSVLDLENLYGKAGLEDPIVEEQMDRMLLAAKARKPDRT